MFPGIYDQWLGTNEFYQEETFLQKETHSFQRAVHKVN